MLIATPRVVCVHGLGGGSTRTWTNFDVEPPFFWLRDGLAKDFPRLRILSFGYPKTFVGSSVSSLSLTDEARNLRNLLELVSIIISGLLPVTWPY
ncbi:hypothetical protein IMZ48_37855, partial [Candidatus Bathyarchaeota archaeon]|nr:hypothetical protein [Candidatus Bathyarchaeota archaeon]